MPKILAEEVGACWKKMGKGKAASAKLILFEILQKGGEALFEEL